MLFTDYLNKFQVRINFIESVRATIGVHSHLIQEKVDIIQSTYTISTGDALTKLNNE